MLEQELKIAIAAAYKAGEMSLACTLETAHTEYKETEGYSPVTRADKEIDVYLKKTLLEAFPNDGWLSEEIEDTNERFEKKRTWIVDPIDGTRGFVSWLEEGVIADEHQFTISIGLVENGIPVLGVVYAPLKRQLFSATKGSGLFLNQLSFQRSPSPKLLKDATYLISFSECKEGLYEKYTNFFNAKPYSSVAYKLALTAYGIEGDLTGSLRPKNEWDTAAGDFLCREAGLIVTDLSGAQLSYNNKIPKVAGLIAADPNLHVQVAALFPKVPQEGCESLVFARGEKHLS